MFLINILSQFNNPPFCGEAKLCGGWSNITSLHYYIHTAKLDTGAASVHVPWTYIRMSTSEVSMMMCQSQEQLQSPSALLSWLHNSTAGSCPSPSPSPSPSSQHTWDYLLYQLEPSGHTPQADLQPLLLHLTFPRMKAKCLMSFSIHSYIHSYIVCVDS